MTGCDLRFLAEEMGRSIRARFDGRSEASFRVASEVTTLAEQLSAVPLLADLAFKVRQLASLVTEQADGLSVDASAAYAEVSDTIEKVREHFHEAVDERVESESDGKYDEEAVDEKVREAVDAAIESIKENIEHDVVRAIRDSEAD